ncbi:MAG TPA: hypothetical protein PLP74_19170 [Quisquiliibacterium sp.]|nr:hypothetical protein [Quisquiliibacterium sp.]
MPLTHLTLDELQQHAAVKPDDPELVAEVMARFTAGGLSSVEEVESRIADGFEAGREAAREEENDVAYQAGWDAGFEEGFNKASGRIE